MRGVCCYADAGAWLPSSYSNLLFPPCTDLQHVTIAYFDAATCQALYPFGQIKPGMLCAGALAGGKDR